MLYTSEDYMEVKKARNKILLKILIATFIFIGVIIVCSIVRISWPGYVVAGLWAIYVVFIWGMKGSRARKYYHFLRDISEGLENHVVGTVKDIDSSISINDMLEFYTITVIEDDTEPDAPARKIYLDVAKGLPNFKEGSRVSLDLFGNYIKGIEVL
jgi:hypothetical protein